MLSRCSTRLSPIASKATRRSPTVLEPRLSSFNFRLHSTETSKHDKKSDVPESISRIKTSMISHLSESRPQAALSLFLNHLSCSPSPHSDSTGKTLEGLIWIFFQYRQPRLALVSIEQLNEKGFQISTRLATKLFKSFKNELMFDQNGNLVKILRWIQLAIQREGKEEGNKVNVQVVEVVIEVLKRMGRNDWSRQVFEAYRETLRDDQVGDPKLWASAISAQAAGGDVMAAQLLFKDWRTKYLALELQDSLDSSPPPPPPEQPYLALLNHFAVNSPPLPASKDPAYLLLQLMKHDRIVPSTSFLNALLRTELLRRRFSSFWGIWNSFDNDYDNGRRGRFVERDHSSWKLASRAKLISDESRRQRGRLHNSPLLHLSPIRYTECHTPTSRALFSHLLSDRLRLTSNRPSLRLSTSHKDPLKSTPTSSKLSSSSSSSSTSIDQASTTLLNSFLNLFLSRQDYSAAVVVLESFHVHSISPNSSTHSTVVLSIIKLWEKGKLDHPNSHPTSRGDQSSSLLFGSGTIGIEGKESERRSRAIQNFKRGGHGAIEAIKKIIEQRKWRIGLWQQREQQRSASPEPTEEEEQQTENEAVGEEGEAPRWMLQREMRDTSYLVDLLRRCSGLEQGEWEQVLHQTRKELLPLGKRRRARRETADDDDEVVSIDETRSKNKKITRGARFRKETFGKNL